MSQQDPTGYGIGFTHKPDKVTPPEPDLGPLFSGARPPDRGVSSPSRSLPKSVDVAGRAAEGRRQKILRYMELNGPTAIHDFCAAQATPTLPNQVSGRFTDMAGELLLCVAGEKAHPISGAACNIYAITDAGRQELQRMKSQVGRATPPVSAHPQETR